MDRADEFAFAWALLDEAATFLDAPTRIDVCVRIGAGEYRETITQLLGCFVESETALPPALSASLWAWINGFVGSDFETPLRHLVSRIRVSNSAEVPGPIPTQDPLVSMTPRRSERYYRRLTLAKVVLP